MTTMKPSHSSRWALFLPAAWMSFAMLALPCLAKTLNQIKAEAGDIQAQLDVGSMYYDGNGVKRDYKEAARWFRKAANQNNAEAQLMCGIMAKEGQGVARPLNSEAMKWFRKSADQGNPTAQFRLGICYTDGTAEKNLDEAMRWFRKAADGGIDEAQFNVARSAFNRNDFTEAVQWFLRAAHQGNTAAQCRLVDLYARGLGVVKDPEKAYSWLLLVMLAGNDKLQIGNEIYRPDRFERALTPSEQQAAREWAKNWRPKIESMRGERPTVDYASGTERSTLTSTGSGFLISSNGYFITANHVVDGASRIQLKTAIGTFDAKVVTCDKANDLAILMVTNAEAITFSPLAVPERPGIQLGQTVFTIGFPNPDLQGTNPKMSKGEISALSGFQDDPRTYQISVPSQPGNSGGVIADEQGNAVGVVVTKLNAVSVARLTGDIPQNVNYALKSTYARLLFDNVPGLANMLPTPSTHKIAFDEAVQKVQAASALVVAFGQDEAE